MSHRSKNSPRTRRSQAGFSRRDLKRTRPWFEGLESRELLASVMSVGDATIFTQLPGLPEGQESRPFQTPSDQPVLQSNIVADTKSKHVPPAIATGSPAATKPVPSNQTWSTMLTRNPDVSQFLTNDQTFVLVDGSGHPITTGNGTPVSYNEYYQRLNQTPPAPKAPFFGRSIQRTTVDGVTTYAYALDENGALKPAGRLTSTTQNESNPNSFGVLSFSTNAAVNNQADATTNFGLSNTPFTTTPRTLFTLTSTARYLEYRPNKQGSPNGSQAVTVQVQTAPGQFQTIASNGLIPYYDYDLPKDVAATNSFAIPNFGDLGVSVMDLGQPSTGPFTNPKGLDANNLQLWDYSDHAATVTWGDGEIGRLFATMSSASPFSQFTYVPGTSTDDMSLLLRNNLQALNGVNIDTTTPYPDLNAIVITGYAKPNTSGMKVVQDPNALVKVFYVVYLPTGYTIDSSTVFSTSDGIDYQPGLSPAQVPLFGAAANDIFLKVPKGAGNTPFHFVIAALPNDDKSTVATFRDYAFNYITGSTGEFNFDSATNQVGLNLNITTENVDPASTQPGALLVIYPHQYDHLSAAPYNTLYLPDAALPGSPLTISTLFGNARLMRAPTTGHTATIAYSLPYNGSLSIFPQGAFISTDPNDAPSASKDDLALEIQLIKDLLTNQDVHALLTNNGLGDTYVWGQQLSKLTALVPIADQLGLANERDMLLAMVKSELTMWFSAQRVLNNDAPSQVLGYDPHFGVPQFLSYDGTWDALIGYYAGHLADLGLNDFMYQWGYWIKAASIVATYDPSFLTGYGPMITMLVQNVANWDRNNTMFPYLRTFDTYAGHSWASGVVAVGDGQNLESISEAINFDSSMIDWGNLLMASAKVQDPSDPTFATGLKIRDTGIAMKTFEAATYQEYFLNANNDTFPKVTTVMYGGNTYAVAGYIQRESYEQHPADYTKWTNEIYASNQFVIKRGTQTFFAGKDTKTANNAESHYAITVLPFTPASLYLGDNPTLAEANYARYIAQQNYVYDNPVPGQKRDLPIAFFFQMLGFQAVTDPTGALDRWNGIHNFRFDFPPNATPAERASDNYTKYALQATLDTYAATFYDLQFFNKYGKVAVDGMNGPVRALGGATATAVLDKAPSGSSATYDRTYIIENVSSNPLANVMFSDGITVDKVPARSVYVTTIKRSTPGGPIVRIVTNTYLIPDLSKASVQPPKGSGTNLFLGYSTPAAPQTATIEPLTLQPQTKAGLVSVTPYLKDPQDKTFQYVNATPYVGQPAHFFPGSALPKNNIVSFQMQNVNGTYDPKLDTHFQLYFKAPFGANFTDLQIGVQVRYTNGTGDTAVSYVETYPRVSISSIGGLVVVTDTSLGVIGAVPNLGSGVAAATRTVGKGELDPNLFFDVFKQEGQNANLVYPNLESSPLLNRTAQFSKDPFKLTNGTVTFTVFIARFNNNNSNFTFANPELQFIAGLPGYAGMRSFLTIPFNDVTIGKLPEEPPAPMTTFTRLISPAPNAVIDGQISTVSMIAAVTSGGRPVWEGQVRFIENGGRSLGFARVVNGKATLVLRQPLLSGNDTITAIYSDPDGNDFAPSQSAPVHVEIDTVKTDRNGVEVSKPGGQERFDIEPFGRAYPGGVNVAGLELGNHRIPVLFAAPQGGRAPLVKAYNALTGALMGSILAYNRNDRGAISIATAGLNGRDFVVTAPGRGQRPVVKVFDAFSGRLVHAINAFAPGFRNGTTVSTFVNRAGTGFVIRAETRFRGKSYVALYNGLTGARISVPLVARSTTR